MQIKFRIKQRSISGQLWHFRFKSSYLHTYLCALRYIAILVNCTPAFHKVGTSTDVMQRFNCWREKNYEKKNFYFIFERNYRNYFTGWSDPSKRITSHFKTWSTGHSFTLCSKFEVVNLIEVWNTEFRLTHSNFSQLHEWLFPSRHCEKLEGVNLNEVWNTELRLTTSNFEQGVKEWPLLHFWKCEVIRFEGSIYSHQWSNFAQNEVKK